MSWDDDETVLTRGKLKWLEEQTAAQSAVKVRDTRFDFFRQLLGLVLKNLHLRISLGIYFFPIVVMIPMLAVGLLALIDRTTNVPPVVDLPEKDFFTLGFASAGSAALQCAVFEAVRGSVIGGAWCSPMLFAPASNREVLVTMQEVASRNSWSVSRLSKREAESSERPGGCAQRTCMLAFDDSETLALWLENNPGRAATAIVFVDDSSAASGVFKDQSGSDLPRRTAFEIWYNATALPLYSLAGVDVLANYNDTSALIISAQHAVEEVLSSRRLGGAASRVHFRRYPRLRTARYWDVQRYYGLLTINVPVSLHAMGLLVQAVAEKEMGMLVTLRSLGLYEMAWWISLYMQHAAESAIMASCIYAMGTIVRLPMFVMTDFWVWFSAIWLFGMAACSTACFFSIFIRRRSAASALGGIGVILAAFIALWPASADLRFEPLLTLFQDPNLLTVDTGILELVYPPFAFLKVIFDITELTKRTPQLDPTSGLTTYQPDGSYLLHDLYAGNYTGTYESVAASRPGTTAAETTFVLRPTSTSLEWMATRCIVSFLLTWWLSQIVTRGHGRARHLLFFLSPSYWWPPSRLRGNAQLLSALRLRGDSQSPHLDVDVAAEEYAVLGGNLPDEKPVVFYDVHKSYGRTPVVNGLSVSLQEHELFALLGRNGVGKSTIVKMLATHSRITSGDMLLYGASVENDMDAVRRVIGVCSQDDVLFPSLTASQHLWLFGRFHGVHRRKLREEVPRALDAVNLSKVAHKRTHGFSGGMKRRLSIAIAYIGDSKVMALDEPTSGMDPYNRKKVWNLISTTKTHGRTTLLTTHSMEEAEVLAHTVGIMSHGQLIALGSAPHLKRRFGAGYTIKLVTKRDSDSLARLQREVLAS
jgi:ABC-type multidrug transport system ATPase subunit